jgi:hypothetical protein
VVLGYSLLRAYVAEHIQLLLVLSTHTFFLSGWVVETREFCGTALASNRVFPQPARAPSLGSLSASRTSFISGVKPPHRASAFPELHVQSLHRALRNPFSWPKVNLGSCRFHRMSEIEIFRQPTSLVSGLATMRPPTTDFRRRPELVTATSQTISGRGTRLPLRQSANCPGGY